jgi:hypothetical protein
MDANHNFSRHSWHDWAFMWLLGKAFSNLHAESAIHIMTIIEISDDNVTRADANVGIQINGKGFYLVGHLLKSSVNAKLKLKPEV